MPSNYPSLADGSLAIPSTSPASLGMPDLSAIGLGFNGVYNTLSVNDRCDSLPCPSNKFYVVHMPTTDALGNSKAGIKTPDMAAPLGTYASYNLRSSGYVAGQQAALTIAYLPLAVTKASKSSTDPAIV